MLRRFFILCLLFIAAMPVWAHSNVLAIEPDVDRTFASTPPEIRMIFTEPIEPAFSEILVYDNQGRLLDLPPATVPEREPISLVLDTSSLEAGVYTVAWRVVSATDGHPSEGTFPLRIGSNAAAISAVMPERSDSDNAGFRAFNLMSLALLMGAAAFPILIWQNNTLPHVDSLLKRYFALVWLMVGISGILLLSLQAAIVAGSWGKAATAIPDLLINTRFGWLWLGRMSLWFVLGYLTRRSYYKHSPLILSMGILLIQSMMSHASGAADSWSAIAADWLHLVAMGLWIGGLVAFFLLLGALRKQLSPLGEVLARFSNMARLAVAMLVITGTYSAWLHVGSVQALLNTDYGQALLIKLVLFLPLLAIGAINLLLTERGLRAGEFVWTKRLRWLLGAEIALSLAIMLAVGRMTSVEPARTAYQPPAPVQHGQFFEMSVSDGMMIHLSIEPNIAGENRFYVDLLNEDMSAPINDASSVQLNFSNGASSSELAPAFQGGGRFVVTSDNLNAAGAWTISLQIERDNQLTTVEFYPIVDAPLDTSYLKPISKQERAIALLLTGGAGIAISLYFSRHPFPSKRIFALASILATGFISASGLFLLLPETLPDDPPIRMIMGAERPYLLTEDGAILQPTENGYEYMPLEMPANDFLMDGEISWLATDEGLFRGEYGFWTLESTMPTNRLISTHGFLLALGDGEIYRIEEGTVVTDRRSLDIPLDADAENFVMMSNHSHVLLNGDSVYSTSSVGLGWTELNAPEPVELIGNDEHGNLLALTASGFWKWDWVTAEWTALQGIPFGVSDWDVFDGKLFVIAEGRVYQEVGNDWQEIALEGNFVDIAYQYPDSLWLLERDGNLWRRRLADENWQHEN